MIHFGLRRLNLVLLRQAKEKSKGTWVEKPLSELEQDCRSEEDRKWLAEQIVASPIPSFDFFEVKPIYQTSSY